MVRLSSETARWNLSPFSLRATYVGRSETTLPYGPPRVNGFFCSRCRLGAEWGLDNQKEHDTLTLVHRTGGPIKFAAHPYLFALLLLALHY